MRRLASAFARMAVAPVFGGGVALVVTLTGGPGSDTLKGTEDSARLSGGGGADALSGLAGGDDLIEAGNLPASEDAVACGTGFDWVEAVAEDDIAGNCERVKRPSIPRPVR